MKDYQGKKIWIIGASSGIGRALAKELVSRGAQLVLSSRDAKALAEIANKGVITPMIVPFDVCDSVALFMACQKVIRDIEIDSVVYMAGHYQPVEILAMDLDEARKIIATNLTGAISVVHEILPYFVKRGKGQIALCASVAGYRGLPHAQPYGATKAALINFAESLRAEVIRKGIDVKVINPGFVKTRMTAKNDFSMPMMIDAGQAARAIADGLNGSAFEIHFPKRFTRLMKLLRLVPDRFYFSLMSR